jgi:drug/metabolite transporter (DMT)-like permease
MIKSLFRISVSVGLIGMTLGIFMGIRQDFVLAPAHAHLNLLGFVTMFLSALYYRAFPQAAASRLALYQAVISIVGAILFPVGIACVLLGGHDRFEPVVVAGALTVFAGMLLFAVIVYRTA